MKSRERGERAAVTGESEEKKWWIALVDFSLQKYWAMWQMVLWLSMQRGFNLNMRTTNSLVTAGLGPVRECSSAQNATVEAMKCLSRGGLWGTMTFPSRDDVRGRSQAFLCERVCVCVFVLLVKVRPEGRATPQINGAAIAGSVTNTLNWHRRFCGESLSWSEGRLPQLWVFSEFFRQAHRAVSNQTLSRLIMLWISVWAESLKS